MAKQAISWNVILFASLLVFTKTISGNQTHKLHSQRLVLTDHLLSMLPFRVIVCFPYFKSSYLMNFSINIVMINSNLKSEINITSTLNLKLTITYCK